MIQQRLKKKYEEWTQIPENTDINDFISVMAEEHNTTPEVIGKVLDESTWLAK